MGNTSKPLTVIVTEEDMLQWDEFLALAAKGHAVMSLSSVFAACPALAGKPPAALVVGVHAHYLEPSMRTLVPHIMTQWQKRAYAPKVKGG